MRGLKLGQVALDRLLALDDPVGMAAQRHDTVLDAAQALEHHRTECQHSSAYRWGETQAAAPAGQFGEDPCRLCALLVHLGHASKDARSHLVEPLLEDARLLALRLQYGRCPLTLCAQGLDLRPQRLHPGLQVSLQRAPTLQSLANFAKTVHLETIAWYRFGRRHMSGQRSWQNRQPDTEQGSEQLGAQRVSLALAPTPAAFRPARKAASRRVARFRCTGWSRVRRLGLAFPSRRRQRSMAPALQLSIPRQADARTRVVGASQTAHRRKDPPAGNRFSPQAAIAQIATSRSGFLMFCIKSARRAIAEVRARLCSLLRAGASPCRRRRFWRSSRVPDPQMPRRRAHDWPAARQGCGVSPGCRAADRALPSAVAPGQTTGPTPRGACPPRHPWC
jgi:hypothetical protein